MYNICRHHRELAETHVSMAWEVGLFTRDPWTWKKGTPLCLLIGHLDHSWLSLPTCNYRLIQARKNVSHSDPSWAISLRGLLAGLWGLASPALQTQLGNTRLWVSQAARACVNRKGAKVGVTRRTRSMGGGNICTLNNKEIPSYEGQVLQSS